MEQSNEKKFFFKKMSIDVVNQILDSMVEIQPISGVEFGRVRNVLGRMGVRLNHSTLIQTCVILNKSGRQFIASQTELKMLDGINVFMSDKEIARRNAIVAKLQEWNMVKVLDKSKIESPRLKTVSVIPLALIKSGEVTVVNPFRPFVNKDA